MAEVYKVIPGTLNWRMAMANANRADKDFVPQAKRAKLSQSDIAELLKRIKSEA